MHAINASFTNCLYMYNTHMEWKIWTGPLDHWTVRLIIFWNISLTKFWTMKGVAR